MRMDSKKLGKADGLIAKPPVKMASCDLEDNYAEKIEALAQLGAASEEAKGHKKQGLAVDVKFEAKSDKSSD